MTATSSGGDVLRGKTRHCVTALAAGGVTEYACSCGAEWQYVNPAYEVTVVRSEKSGWLRRLFGPSTAEILANGVRYYRMREEHIDAADKMGRALG